MLKSSALKNKLTLILLGRSGSGKGTQAKFILKRLRPGGVCYIGTGNLMRAFMKKKGLTALRTREVMKQGNRHPSWLAVFLWIKKLIEDDRTHHHVIFDGAPRGVGEAVTIDEFMEWHGRNLPLCIYLDVSGSEVARRLLQRGRIDDTKRTIHNRLAYFPKLVLPVIHYFKRKKRLIYINGEQSIEKVRRDIDQALAQRLGKRWPRGI